MSSGSRNGSSPTPPSSPPSAAEEDTSYDPKVEAMKREEEKLKEQTRQDWQKRRQKDESTLDGQDNSKSLTDLDWFLSRSQVRLNYISEPKTVLIFPAGLFVGYHGSIEASARS